MTRLAVAGLQTALCALVLAALAGCSCHRPGYFDPHTGMLYEDVSCAPLLGYGFTDRVTYTFNKLKRERLCACTSHCGPMGCPGPAAQCAACGETYVPGAVPTFGGPVLENGAIYTPDMALPPGSNGPVFYGGVIDGGVVDGEVIQQPAQPNPNQYDTIPPKAPPAEEAAPQAAPATEEPRAQSEVPAPAPLRVEPPAVETPSASAAPEPKSVASADQVTQVSAPAEPPKLVITPRAR